MYSKDCAEKKRIGKALWYNGLDIGDNREYAR
jgi:hypothetical protein